MILQAVAIKDTAADAFNLPAFVHSIGLAIRAFQDKINDHSRDNQMYTHPEDFNLFHIGTFDDHSGKFTSLQTPLQIAIGKQLRTNHVSQ